MSNLRRCAFCGGKGELWNNKLTHRLYGVICEECDCMTPYFTTREEAIEAWNRREPIEDIVEQLEEMKDKADNYQAASYSRDEINYYTGMEKGLIKAIEIVKGGAV